MLERVNRMLGASYSDAKFVKRLIDRRKLFAFLKTVEVPRLNGSRRVVFNLVNSAYLRYLLLDSFLAAELSHRGVHPVVLIDDEVLLHHEDEQYDSKGLRRMQFRRWLSRQCIKGAPLYRYYSEFVSREDRARVPLLASEMVTKEDFCFMGVDLWPSIEGSMVRYYKAAPGFLDAEEDYAVQLKASTENALLSCLVAAGVEQEISPEAVITSHGIYTTWGPFHDYFRSRNKRALVYGKVTQKRGAIKYTNREEGPIFEKIKSDITYSVAAEHAEHVMNQRFVGRASDLERLKLESELELPSLVTEKNGREVFGLFPNLFWDRSLANADGLFEGCPEWLAESVGYFLQRPDKILLIRAHPVEAVRQKKPRVGAREVVQQALGKALPPDRISTIGNIVFVPAAFKLKSYQLFEHVTAGLVYNGTIGLEMMYDGIPVIVAGAAPYSRTSFVQSYGSRKDYFRAIDETAAVLSRQENNREDMIKFIYYFFELRCMVLPDFPFSTAFPKSRLFQDLSMILKGHTLSRIADDILTRSPKPAMSGPHASSAFGSA